MIYIENVYHMAKADDVKRFLIDRKWPKGVVRFIPRKEESGRAKKSLAAIKWCPQLAPEAASWKWYTENPEKEDRFRSRYFRELDGKKKHWLPIVQACRQGKVALLSRPAFFPWPPAFFFKEFIDFQLKTGRFPKAGRPESGRARVGVAVPVEKAISSKSRLPLRPETNLKSKIAGPKETGKRR